MESVYQPESLQEAIVYFSSPDNCREYLVAHRWPEGVSCPRCGSKSVLFQAKYNRWQCGSKHDLRQFTSKTGTIFEDSPLALSKWLLAMWQVVNCKNGISSYEIARATGVTQKSAWFMDHRIRVALGIATPDKLTGHVEADETFVRGNVHTNGCENFWSLLKRGIHGTYVSVEPFHLFRYLDEQTFRFNNRKLTDGERFVEALSSVVGQKWSRLFEQLSPIYKWVPGGDRCRVVHGGGRRLRRTG